jgi:heparan-alpha-glucosaminide N-acetyltransferase
VESGDCGGRDEVSTATQASTISTEAVAGQRLASVDILRGLTMVVMIFVNDLASVRGLPWWNYHMKAEVNFMTYVDMVYPFFLFVVGLSIPLAFQQRLKKHPSVPALWLHVLVRALSLVVLGLILANVEKGDPVRMAINPNAWGILAVAGGSLFLSVYKGLQNYSKLHTALRFGGLLLTIVMLAMFRRTVNGHAAWIDFSYPEILGLIGFTYLAVSILYIPTRRWRWAPLGWFIGQLLSTRSAQLDGALS